MKLFSASVLLLSLVAPPLASAALIVDFTSVGDANTVNTGGFVFSTQDPTGTGVSFTVTATAVIPGGGGANGGDITRLNGGLGSEVENTGAFLNVIGGVSEVLQFTISNVLGLQSFQTLQIKAVLSQNPNSQNANQSGGYGGTFGNDAADSITLTSDSSVASVVNQSDLGDLGSVLLNTNASNNSNTGNTYSHPAGNLDFTTSFTLAQTNLTANDAVVIQGFEFAVVPEPSSSLMVLGGLGLLLIRKRRH
jgi:hypothetical protein